MADLVCMFLCCIGVIVFDGDLCKCCLVLMVYSWIHSIVNEIENALEH